MRLDSEDLQAGKSPKFILQPSAKKGFRLDYIVRFEGCRAIVVDIGVH